MSLLDVYMFRAKPGRAADIVTYTRELNEFSSKFSVPKTRLFTTQVGGEATGIRVWITEFDDVRAWGASHATMEASPDQPNLIGKLFGPDAPWEPESRRLLREIVLS